MPGHTVLSYAKPHPDKSGQVQTDTKKGAASTLQPLSTVWFERLYPFFRRPLCSLYS